MYNFKSPDHRIRVIFDEINKKKEEGLIGLIDTTDIQEDSFFEKFENKKFFISQSSVAIEIKKHMINNVKERNGDSKHNKDKTKKESLHRIIFVSYIKEFFSTINRRQT